MLLLDRSSFALGVSRCAATYRAGARGSSRRSPVGGTTPGNLLRRAARQARLAVEAALWLSAASLAVRVLPPRRTMRLFGRPGPPGVGPPGPGASPQARQVGRAVERVAARLAWRPACLPQAIAVRLMLRGRGIPSEGHLGIVETAPLSAHAWVTAGGAIVQGGPVTHATEITTLR
jgi:hypothetical protein